MVERRQMVYSTSQLESNWSPVASNQYGGEIAILSLTFDGTRVRAGTNNNALLLSVLKSQTGGSWTKNADIALSTETKIPSMAIYDDKLYLGTYPHALLYEWDGVSAWVQKATRYTSQSSINSLAVMVAICTVAQIPAVYSSGRLEIVFGNLWLFPRYGDEY